MRSPWLALRAVFIYTNGPQNPTNSLDVAEFGTPGSHGSSLLVMACSQELFYSHVFLLWA